MNYKDAPTETGWYITRTYTGLNPVDPKIRYLGPFSTKLETVNYLKDMLTAFKEHDPGEVIYQILRFIVHVSLDKNAGSWTPKLSDY